MMERTGPNMPPEKVEAAAPTALLKADVSSDTGWYYSRSYMKRIFSEAEEDWEKWKERTQATELPSSPEQGHTERHLRSARSESS